MAGGVELLPGNEELKLKLEEMARRATNFTPAFEIIDESFMAYESRKFDQEGPGWAALQQSTIDRKSTIDGAGGILVRGEPGYTEGLKQSLTTHGPGSLFKISPLSLEMGTSVSYAHWHQDGTGKMPARKVVDTFRQGRGNILLNNWRMILQAYLVKGTIGAAAIGAAASQGA